MGVGLMEAPRRCPLIGVLKLQDAFAEAPLPFLLGAASAWRGISCRVGGATGSRAAT